MSLLFVGVSGLDYVAPAALDRLQAFLTASQEVIYRYEGSLNKLAVDDKGTVLLAMFGAPPLAHADDARGLPRPPATCWDGRGTGVSAGGRCGYWIGCSSARSVAPIVASTP